MSQSVKQLKKQLMGAACAVLMSAVALSSATYAWYVANNTVKATSSTISATTNGFILQIDELKNGAQHGGEQTSLAAAIQGGKITPSSTDDLKNWFVCQGWGSDGRVTSYSQIKFKQDGKPGEYEAGGETHYAYLKSEFIVYTITESGIADVYLEGSDGEPVVVTAHGAPTTDTIPNSLRVGITTQAIDANGNLTGDEALKVVYAPAAVSPTDKGNDKNAIAGWSCVKDAVNGPQTPSYQHIENGNCVGWLANKVGDDYQVDAGTHKIASRVGYDGIAVRIYIWMEGTDADCVNNAAAEDLATYDVTVKLAGVATS